MPWEAADRREGQSYSRTQQVPFLTLSLTVWPEANDFTLTEPVDSSIQVRFLARLTWLGWVQAKRGGARAAPGTIEGPAHTHSRCLFIPFISSLGKNGGVNG